MKATGAEDEKLLLSKVGDLAVLKVKFVHEGLTIKKVVKGFVPNLKKPRTQTEETPFQKCRNPACKRAKKQQIRLLISHRRPEIIYDCRLVCRQTCDRGRNGLSQFFTCLKYLLVASSWVFESTLQKQKHQQLSSIRWMMNLLDQSLSY